MNGTFKVDCSHRKRLLIAVVYFRSDWLKEVDHLRLRKSLGLIRQALSLIIEIVTVEEKLNVYNLMRFRKMVIDGNL